jgi:hypothetical protein
MKTLTELLKEGVELINRYKGVPTSTLDDENLREIMYYIVDVTKSLDVLTQAQQIMSLKLPTNATLHWED